MVLGYIEYTISHDDAFRFLPQLHAARQNSPRGAGIQILGPWECNLNILAMLYARVHGLIARAMQLALQPPGKARHIWLLISVLSVPDRAKVPEGDMLDNY